MEIVFAIAALTVTLAMIYGIGRTMHSHRGVIDSYRSSEALCLYHLTLGLIMSAVIFVALCAANNTFFHLPYLTM